MLSANYLGRRQKNVLCDLAAEVNARRNAIAVHQNNDSSNIGTFDPNRFWDAVCHNTYAEE